MNDPVQKYSIKELTNLIYDKLADNDALEVFMAYMSDDMVCIPNDGIIGILLGDRQIKITITETKDIWQD